MIPRLRPQFKEYDISQNRLKVSDYDYVANVTLASPARLLG